MQVVTDGDIISEKSSADHKMCSLGLETVQLHDAPKDLLRESFPVNQEPSFASAPSSPLVVKHAAEDEMHVGTEVEVLQGMVIELEQCLQERECLLEETQTSNRQLRKSNASWKAVWEAAQRSGTPQQPRARARTHDASAPTTPIDHREFKQSLRASLSSYQEYISSMVDGQGSRTPATPSSISRSTPVTPSGISPQAAVLRQRSRSGPVSGPLVKPDLSYSAGTAANESHARTDSYVSTSEKPLSSALHAYQAYIKAALAAKSPEQK